MRIRIFIFLCWFCQFKSCCSKKKRIQSKQNDIEVEIDPVAHQYPKSQRESLNSKSKSKAKTQKDPNSLIRPQSPLHAPKSKEGVVVECLTTKGSVYIEVMKEWAPYGAERFIRLVNSNFFSSKVALFRVVPEQLVQFGISGNVSISKQWHKSTIKDDPQWLLIPRNFNKGFVSFAGGGSDSRNTQLFMTLARIPLGDASHEVPFGRLITAESFTTMSRWSSAYGDFRDHGGNAPDPTRILSEGSHYLGKEYPELDYFKSCDIMVPKGQRLEDIVLSFDAYLEQSQSSSSNTQHLPHLNLLHKRPQLRRRDLDYNRSVPPPPRPLPIFARVSPVTFPPSSASQAASWWVAPLREAHEVLSRGMGTREDRYCLNPNEAHVVDDFFNKQKRIEFRNMIGRLRDGGTQGSISTIHQNVANNAATWVGFPHVFDHATGIGSNDQDREIILDALIRVWLLIAFSSLFSRVLCGLQHQFQCVSVGCVFVG
mmetsp:Transcript_36846/g.47611  ORF Transcript_36846/g.47611 Transcript_36846/m.47611 type:complete len:484 (-) Transcript_36846:1050-2501(-)